MTIPGFPLFRLALLTLFLVACATGTEMSEQTPSPATYAGFLTYPDRLQPVPGDSGAYRWSESNARLAQYHKFMLPVNFPVINAGWSLPVVGSDRANTAS